MKKLQIISVFTAACVLAFSGCSSRGTYVNADKSGVIGTGIDIQDFNNASAALVNDLLSSGALDNLGLKMPIKMLVSRVKCDVGEPINRDLLTNRICMALNNSGKVVAVKDDPQTVELYQAEARKLGKNMALPKITLTGSITQLNASDSDVKQVTYVFSMQVNRLGNSIWMGEKQITKQFTKSSFGF